MAIPGKVTKFLTESKVKYDPIEHRTVYTAYDKAATLKLPQKIIGKNLVLALDGRLTLVLISANKSLDKNKLRKLAKVKKIDFVSERIIKNRIKGVKLGSVPPFGIIWRLSTFVDGSLLKNTKIILNAGDCSWSIKISPVVFRKLMHGNLVIGNFSKKN